MKKVNKVLHRPHLLVASAMKSEIAKLLKTYKPEIVFKTKKYSLLKKNTDSLILYFGITGVGRKNVKKFFKEYFKLKIKPALLISTGYAGAINPLLKVGDIVVAGKFICDKNKYYLKLSQKHKKYSATGFGVKKIVSRYEKLELRKKYPGVDFVDMESCEVIKICRENKINFVIIRTISDTLDFEFPDYEFLKDTLRNIKLLKSLSYIIKNPPNLYKILKLKWNLYKARNNLCNALIDFINSQR